VAPRCPGARVSGRKTAPGIGAAVAGAVHALRTDESARAAMVDRFRSLRAQLGGGRGTVRVAEMARELMVRGRP